MDGVSKRMFTDLILKLLFKKSVDIFENIEIAETTYEGVVEISYQKKITRVDANHDVIRLKMSEEESP